MTKKVRMLLIPLALVISGAIWSSSSHHSLAQIKSEQSPLEERVDNTVREAGVLEGVNSLEVVNQVPGSSALLWMIPDGTVVKKGEPLANIDSSQIEEQIQHQMILVFQTETTRRETENLLKQASLEQKIALSDSNWELNKSQQILEQIENLEGDYGLQVKTMNKELKLFKEKLELVEIRLKDSSQAPQQKLQNRLTKLDFHSKLETIQSALDHLTSFTIPLHQQQRKRQIERAKKNLELKQLQYQAQVDRAAGQLQAHKIEEGFARDRLKALEVSRDNCRIIAPRDGIVIHSTFSSRRSEPETLEVGAIVKERQHILTMPDLKNWQVRVHVHETKAARVKAGQSVTLLFDGLPKTKFTGKVISVSDVALPGVWPNYSDKQFEVIVSLPKPNETLKLGMTCLAEIDVRD